MEYVKVFPCDAENSVSRPGGATRCAEKKFFEPRSPGGTGILRDIVQVSEPVRPALFHPTRRFPHNRPGSPFSLQTFPPPFVPPYLLAFFFACMARGYTPSPLFLSLFPSVDSSTLSIPGGAHPALSLSPLSCTFHPL